MFLPEMYCSSEVKEVASLNILSESLSFLASLKCVCWISEGRVEQLGTYVTPKEAGWTVTIEVVKGDSLATFSLHTKVHAAAGD